MNKIAFNLLKTIGKTTLGIPRSKMPQIKNVRQLGVDYVKTKIDPKIINPTQSFIDSKKVENFKGSGRGIIVSSDGHVVDGHHRWAKALMENKKVNAYIINSPIQEALTKTALSKNFVMNAFHDTLLRSNKRFYDIEDAINKTHEIMAKTPSNKILHTMGVANLDRKTKRALKVNPITSLPFGQKIVAKPLPASVLAEEHARYQGM